MEASGRAPWGRRPPVEAGAQRGCPMTAAMKWSPALLQNFHWLFPPPQALWSGRGLTTRVTWAPVVSPQAHPSPEQMGVTGVLPGSLSAGPLPSRGTLTCPRRPAPRPPRLLRGCQQLPEDEWKAGRSEAEPGPGPPGMPGPMAQALKGFQRISGVERKFFLIISSFFLVGSVNFSRRQGPELYGNQMICYSRERKDN